MGNKNRYLTDFDKKVNSIVAQYERGEISKRVLQAALGIMFGKHYGERMSNTISSTTGERKNQMVGISLKRITEYYNEGL